MRLNSPPYPYPPKNNSTVAHGGNPMISTLYRSNTRICQQHRKKYSRETKRELLPYRNRVRHAHRSYRTARSIGDGGHFFAWVATRIPPCVSGERGGGAETPTISRKANFASLTSRPGVRRRRPHDTFLMTIRVNVCARTILSKLPIPRYYDRAYPRAIQSPA